MVGFFILSALCALFAIVTLITNLPSSIKSGDPVEIATTIFVFLIFAGGSAALAWLALRKKKRNAEKRAEKNATSSASGNASSFVGSSFSFEAAGVFAKKKELLSIAQMDNLFKEADDVIIQKSNGKKIYQCHFRNLTTLLIPEPTNPHDPNAVMVVVNGACVGYVPAELCTKVKQIVSKSYHADARIGGGAVKYVQDDMVMVDSYEYTVRVTVYY